MCPQHSGSVKARARFASAGALCGIVLTQYFPNFKYWIMLLTKASEAKSVRKEHSIQWPVLEPTA
jgi:hypothetical protein